MLDDIDKKLIMALQENGRATQVDLARQIGIHVSTVANRMDSLEKAGVIKIKALPNPYKLGYSANAYIAMKIARGEIDGLCDHLYKKFNVNTILTTFGSFDILIGVYFSNWEQLLNFVSTELSSSSRILRIEVFLVKDIKKRYHSVFMMDKSPIKIDKIDEQIIGKLAENGRYTARYLAKELGISLPTAVRRISYLLNKKVIEIKAILNPATAGFLANAFLLLKVNPNKIEDICTKLSEYEDIFLIGTLFNGYDIFVGVNAPSPEELHKFIHNKVLSLDGVIDNEIIIRAEIKKRFYGVPVLF